MGHFESEAKLNLWIFLAPSLIALLFVIVWAFAFGIVDTIRADRCLDRGGSYDYESGDCDFAKSHSAPK